MSTYWPLMLGDETSDVHHVISQYVNAARIYISVYTAYYQSIETAELYNSITLVFRRLAPPHRDAT